MFRKSVAGFRATLWAVSTFTSHWTKCFALKRINSLNSEISILQPTHIPSSSARFNDFEASDLPNLHICSFINLTFALLKLEAFSIDQNSSIRHFYIINWIQLATFRNLTDSRWKSWLDCTLTFHLCGYYLATQLQKLQNAVNLREKEKNWIFKFIKLCLLPIILID